MVHEGEMSSTPPELGIQGSRPPTSGVTGEGTMACEVP